MVNVINNTSEDVTEKSIKIILSKISIGNKIRIARTNHKTTLGVLSTSLFFKDNICFIRKYARLVKQIEITADISNTAILDVIIEMITAWQFIK